MRKSSKTPALRHSDQAHTSACANSVMQNSGLDPAPSDPAAFRAYIKAELAKWSKVIREAGIKPE